MQQLKKGKTRIKALCLLVLFAVYQAGYTAFLHVHYVDGVPVVHSHPFHQTHGHTHSSYLAIGHAEPLTSPTGGEAVCPSPLLVLLTVLYCAPLARLAVRRPWGRLALRAPPTSFFIR